MRNLPQKLRKDVRISTIRSLLEQQKPFVDALKTDIGKQLLDDVLKMLEKGISLEMEEKSTDKSRADFRAAKEIASIWANKIAIYNKTLNSYKEQS